MRRSEGEPPCLGKGTGLCKAQKELSSCPPQLLLPLQPPARHRSFNQQQKGG